jgi:predicted GNAT superfamily acetyltransferase
MPIEVREIAALSEFASAVHLQRTIWGWDDLDILPVRFFVVAKNIGGHILGAFDRDFMFGFCLAIPGLKPDGTVYLHSHMLGVLPEYRDSQAGYLMKMAQRDAALSRGIRLVEWTFDPLELKNAYFNLEKLGAVVRRYAPNQYGMTTSPLHGGLPTDRCVAEWHLDRERIPVTVEARIEVPADIQTIKRTDPPHARAIQQQIGERFLELLAGGLAAVGFERSEKAGAYLFGRIQE